MMYYRDLVENCPGSETYSMLGDAYLAIQEPERAIEAYELSLQSNPQDKALVRKMGRALVKTHQYAKAISYYKEAVKQEGCRDLKLDMAELFMKLKQFDKAEEALLEELNGTVIDYYMWRKMRFLYFKHFLRGQRCHGHTSPGDARQAAATASEGARASG